MSTTWAMCLFVASLLLTAAASAVLSRRIEQLGNWLRLSQSFLGIVAALGADSPEISSSISALYHGHNDLGLGIVLGSNIFNLAALLGLAAVVTRHVQVSRRTLLLNGGVALGVLAASTVQLLGVLSPGWSLGLIAAIMVPYVAATAIPASVALRMAQSFGVQSTLGLTVEDANQDADRETAHPRPSTADITDVLLTLVCVVLGSIGLVRSAVVLGAAWHVPTPLLGIVVLASLTGLPNVITAIQLSRRGRGSAVLSEALNSNTLNLIVGVSLPMLFFPSTSLHPRSVLALWWLCGMTVLALGLALLRGGLNRASGGLLIAVHLAFILCLLL